MKFFSKILLRYIDCFFLCFDVEILHCTYFFFTNFYVLFSSIVSTFFYATPKIFFVIWCWNSTLQLLVSFFCTSFDVFWPTFFRLHCKLFTTLSILFFLPFLLEHFYIFCLNLNLIKLERLDRRKLTSCDVVSISDSSVSSNWILTSLTDWRERDRAFHLHKIRWTLDTAVSCQRPSGDKQWRDYILMLRNRLLCVMIHSLFICPKFIFIFCDR